MRTPNIIRVKPSIHNLRYGNYIQSQTNPKKPNNIYMHHLRGIAIEWKTQLEYIQSQIAYNRVYVHTPIARSKHINTFN